MGEPGGIEMGMAEIVSWERVGEVFHPGLGFSGEEGIAEPGNSVCQSLEDAAAPLWIGRAG